LFRVRLVRKIVILLEKKKIAFIKNRRRYLRGITIPQRNSDSLMRHENDYSKMVILLEKKKKKKKKEKKNKKKNKK